MTELETTAKNINIALIGHVANGKTTLVRSLTGVNTKRRSDEIKSGRTIKLGYANCLVWKCGRCHKVATTGQNQKKYACCGQRVPKPSHYISFLDCPGHHSYVTNMIKGSAVVDCALLVTDVRKNTLQVQTLEHLAIIQILGVKNIIVVQNKVDLVDPEQCYNHYKMLKVELQRTAAENSPIIPVSAETGLQVEVVQDYLCRMVEDLEVPTSSHNVFSVIRSFDINRPGCSNIDSLKGGILGGTSLGKGFQVGDFLEVRPGLIKADRTHFPLKLQIRSIFAEKKSLQKTVRGGLYGVGTALDPSLTKNDGLVGCLVGKPEDLPEVQTELTMVVVRLRHGFDGGNKVPKIKAKHMYRLIIGSNVVQAVCTSRQKPKAVMSLLRPVCIIDKKCLIYSCESSNTQLIGFGILSDEEEKECVPIQQSEEEYTTILPQEKKEEKVKTSIPVPVMVRENRNTIWSNLGTFCQVVHRQETQVVNYIQQELCITANVCQSGLRIFKMRIQPRKMQKLLKKYITEQVACDQCKGVDTETRKNRRNTEIVCKTCGSSRML